MFRAILARVFRAPLVSFTSTAPVQLAFPEAAKTGSASSHNEDSPHLGHRRLFAIFPACRASVVRRSITALDGKRDVGPSLTSGR